jgi:hypothetical protein
MTSRMLFELLGFLLSTNALFKVKKMTTVSAVMFEIVEMYIFQIHLHYFFFSVLYVKASPLSGEDFASPLNRYFSQITLTNRIYLYKVTRRRCRYFWTSMCVNLRENYIQLKGQHSVNTRRTFSKFVQHLDKMHRYNIYNAQREIV